MKFPATAGGGDDFGQQLLKIMLARTVQGESQIDEHIERNAHTAGTMPLAQAFVGGLGVMAVLIGLGLIGWQVAYLLGTTLTPGDFLLLACLALLLFLAAAAVMRTLARDFSQPAIVILSVALGGMLFVGLMAAILSHREALTWWRAGLTALGLVFLIPGLALAYRQLVDLLDPFGKLSAMERVLRPYLPLLFGTPEPEPEYSRLVPYRRANGAQALGLGNGVLHPDDANLLDFTRRAADVGLSRRVWLGQTLPTTTQIVTRDLYDSLLERLVQFGYAVPGGEGHAARWIVPAAEALADLETQAQMFERG